MTPEQKINRIQRSIRALEKVKDATLQRSIAMEGHIEGATLAAADGRLGEAVRHANYAVALARSCGARVATVDITPSTRKKKSKRGPRVTSMRDVIRQIKRK
jgi:hypothetical protein